MLCVWFAAVADGRGSVSTSAAHRCHRGEGLPAVVLVSRARYAWRALEDANWGDWLHFTIPRGHVAGPRMVESALASTHRFYGPVAVFYRKERESVPFVMWITGDVLSLRTHADSPPKGTVLLMTLQT